MTSKEDDDIDIGMYFLPIEWSEMSGFERTRFRNILENHVTMKSFGVRHQEPDFLKEYNKREEEKERPIKALPPAKVYKVNEGASTSSGFRPQTPATPKKVFKINEGASTSASNPAVEPPSCLSVWLDIEKYFTDEEWAQKSLVERERLRAKLESYSLNQTHNVSFYCAECNSVFTSPLYLEQHKMACLLGLRANKSRTLPALTNIAHNERVRSLNNAAQNQQSSAINKVDVDCSSKQVASDVINQQTETIRDGQGWKCELCNAQFRSKHSLRYHIRGIHENDRPYKCDVCDKAFVKRSDLKKHMNGVHLKVKLFKCNMCQYKSTKNADLQIHINGVHLDIRQFKCSECNYKSSANSSLQRHIKAVHKKLRSFQCVECNYKCSLNSNLQRHIKAVHKKLLLFQCTECDYKCSENGHLQRHIKAVHRKLRPFQCVECNYKCSLNSNLQTHIKTVHLKLRLFECSECNYKFSTNSNLQTHMRLHTGEKPYQCTLCQYKCSDRSSLTHHIKTKHIAGNCIQSVLKNI